MVVVPLRTVDGLSLNTLTPVNPLLVLVNLNSFTISPYMHIHYRDTCKYGIIGKSNVCAVLVCNSLPMSFCLHHKMFTMWASHMHRKALGNG